MMAGSCTCVPPKSAALASIRPRSSGSRFPRGIRCLRTPRARVYDLRDVRQYLEFRDAGNWPHRGRRASDRAAQLDLRSRDWRGRPDVVDPTGRLTMPPTRVPPSSQRTIRYYEHSASEYSRTVSPRPPRSVASALRRLVKHVPRGGRGMGVAGDQTPAGRSM